MKHGLLSAEVLVSILMMTCAPGRAQTITPIAVPTPTTEEKKLPGRSESEAQAGGTRRPGMADSVGTVNTKAATTREPSSAPAPGVLIDQVIGTVNGDLILESDIDEERRFESFEPFSAPGAFSRDKAIERLVDRSLILQQAKLQPDQAVTKDEAKEQLQSLRKDLPACKAYSCESDAGWNRFVHDHGFTMNELVERWQERMEILKFIEMRFRSGIEITPDQIKSYYEKTMLPEYAHANATPPKLGTISDRIQEVLLEQQVTALLADWLKSLKAEGSVRIMRPGEVQP